MKIMTVMGTRPEIIRLSRIISQLDQHCQHVLVHTGQNSTRTLRDIFLQDLGVRQPDYDLHIQGSDLGQQVGSILVGCEEIIRKERPDRLLVLGDTNSGLSAYMAKRLGVPVYHMEAGNRCYDDRVPEEVNRRVIDHSSDVLLPYTHRSKDNLVREGIPRERIFVTGNPIFEVISSYRPQIARSSPFTQYGVKPKNYFLVTAHRAENVDIEERLRNIVLSIEQAVTKYNIPAICSFHPRTRDRVREHGIAIDHPMVRWVEPLGFFDFISLEENARCVLTDSGTVQEECCILGVPNVTIRDVTERPETIECGSGLLSGNDPSFISRAIDLVLQNPPSWKPPDEYMAANVSEIVLNILTGWMRK
jgi:UDP-N-acetylglucosamine 2-epimerase (non-hydrolysing)